MAMFKKGSKQAKEYMAQIRAMKGTKKVAVKKTTTKKIGADYYGEGKEVTIFDLKKGTKYEWIIGAKYMEVEYIGESSRFAKSKVKSKIGAGGYIFKFIKDNTYVDLSYRAVNQYLRTIPKNVSGYTKGSSKFIEQGEKPIKGQTNYRVTRNDTTLLTKGGTFKNFAKLSGYAPQNEIVIGKVSTEKKLKDLAPQVKLRISRGKAVDTIVINTGQKSVDVFKKYITKNMIETQEFFAVMYLNNANKCLGVYLVGQGGFTSVVAERRLLLTGALLIGATSLILCHNHPSGQLKPSDADKQFTKVIVQMANEHDIRVLDHVIITKDSFFSFTENGLL
jgi:DNA repair protein RadC